MATLQARAGTARGTVSSLANVAMYGGITLGVAIAGPIFDTTEQFIGVSILAMIAYVLALPLLTHGHATPSDE